MTRVVCRYEGRSLIVYSLRSLSLLSPKGGSVVGNELPYKDPSPSTLPQLNCYCFLNAVTRNRVMLIPHEQTPTLTDLL